MWKKMEVDGNQWKSVGVCTAARGSPYYYYVPMIFFWTFARFSPVPVGLFSCSRLRSSQGPACTPRYKFGFRAGSVARALGVQSREIWLGTHGVAFRGARAEQDNGKPTCQLFRSKIFVLCAVSCSRTSTFCVDHYYACVNIAGRNKIGCMSYVRRMPS